MRETEKVTAASSTISAVRPANGPGPAISGWDPGREAQRFFPYMPLKNVTAAYPPTALIHGTADTDVPFQQSQLMAQELQRHGVAFQFHPIAQAEHGLAGGNPKEVKEAERKAFEFVKLYLERP